MGTQPSPELTGLMAAWRRHMTERGFAEDDMLDELEGHLWEEVDRLRERGLPPRQAFFEAAARLGHEDAIATEYRKAREIPQPKRAPFEAIAWAAALAKSYAATAIRGLLRHRAYAAINALGLALGLAMCLVIGLFVMHELSYDRHFPEAERTYRVYLQMDEGDIARTPLRLVQALESRFPEVERATAMGGPSRRIVTFGEERFYLEDLASVDEDFLSVFPFPLLQGDPETALSAPHQMVLTRSTARRLFGEEEVVGQRLTIDNEAEYTVAGVMEDVPRNTHFQLNGLLSRGEQEGSSGAVQWNSFRGGFLYLTLKEHADPAALEEKIRSFEAESREGPGSTEPRLRLQPLTRIHLYSTILPSNDIAPQSDARYLFLFAVVGLAILLIAVSNYTNLATARSLDRAREVGVRKVVGARRGQLVWQFVTESVLLALITFPLALGLAHLAAPALERVTGQYIALALLRDVRLLLPILGAVVLVGLVAGAYPALFLSRFRPTEALASRGRGMGRGGVWVRRSLIVFQFAVTTVLLVGVLVIQMQLDYVRGKELGFNEEHVVVLNLPREVADQYEAMKRSLLARPTVAGVTSGAPPGFGWLSASVTMPATDTTEGWRVNLIEADYDYPEVLGLRPIAGRTFEPAEQGELQGAVLLSESAAELLRSTGDLVGERVDVVWYEDAPVIGIIEEIHNERLHEATVPMVVGLKPGFRGNVLVRLRPGSVRDGIADLRTVWEEFIPERPFEFEFLDERIAEQYEAERRLGRIFGLFTGIALLLGCAGLFGLTAFAAERRTKEIGIRKVLGATTPGIVLLLSREVTRLVILGVVVGSPLAYFAARTWLESFAYQIELGPGVFFLSGFAALAVALITVCYQSVQKASSNPVEALRYE